MVKTHGLLRYSANPASESGFRAGRADPAWGVQATPHVTIKLKRMFPRSDPYRDGWVWIVATPEVARDLQWFVQRYPLEADRETWARLRADADDHRSTERAVHEILTGSRPRLEFDLEPDRAGRDYQLVAADLCIATGRLLLTDQLGLGKSMSALLVLRAPDALPALVVCQTHLPPQWEDEVRETWTGAGLLVHTVRTMEVYDPGSHRSMRGRTPDVVVVPYSKLRGWGDHLHGRVRTTIFDEVQELRLLGSQKWTAAARVADGARYRIGTSATPVYNYAGELHTIMEVLAPGELGSREEFIREWGGGRVRSLTGVHVSVKDPAALGMHLRNEGLMLRRTRKEVGRELPDVSRVVHSIDSDEDVMNDLIEDVGVLAELIVARASRESFRARGEFDWKVRRATGIAKAPYVAAFVQLLLETEERVVLWGWHRTVYDIRAEMLAKAGVRCAYYTGSESPAAKRRNVGEFTDGDARVLMMSLRAGAGLDGLQDTCHVGVFGELDWSPGIHEQCIGRLHRDLTDDARTPDPVMAYFLVSEYGSDPEMAETLNVKRMQAEPVQDPDAPLVQPIADVGDRLRRLAESVLEQRRRRASDPRGD